MPVANALARGVIAWGGAVPTSSKMLRFAAIRHAPFVHG
jgi:hypothetical protein